MLQKFIVLLGIIILAANCAKKKDFTSQNPEIFQESSLNNVGLNSFTTRSTDPSLLGLLSTSGPYINWTWNSVYTTLEADMKFEADPGTGKPLFISNQVNIVDSNMQKISIVYIGVQSNTMNLGKGIMFSVWNSESAIPGQGATCQTFINEGTGKQCYMSYNWVANKVYRLKLVMNTDQSIQGYVIDQSTSPATVTYIGQIQSPAVDESGIPKTAAGFGWISQWTEWYGGQVENCGVYPYSKVLRYKPIANAGAIQSSGSSYYYSTGSYMCNNTYNWANGADNYQEIGNPGASKRIYMQTYGGYTVQPEVTTLGLGGGAVRANDKSLDAGTMITRIALPSGKVALQTRSGHYLSCTNGGGSTVTATSRTVGNYESFTETVSLGKVTYKSYGGKYLTATLGGGSDIKCTSTFASLYEQFTHLTNKASSATVSVSSESTTYGQVGAKAIDGVIDGYPGDVTREWATNGETAGAWIKLAWAVSTKVSMITLYDRPNTTDQVLSGTLTFSDGSSIPVGALPDDAKTGLNFSFTAKNITWVKFQINSAAGSNIGLAEFQAWGK